MSFLVDVIQKDELLYRVIKRSRRDVFTPDNQLSSALFKDNDPSSLGISVDRDGDRNDEEVLYAFQDFFKERLKGLTRLSVNVCFENNVYITPDPSSLNVYHALLYGDENENELSSLQALILTDNSELIFFNPEVEWTI